METFNEWFEENKDSHILMEEYREYVNECYMDGFSPVNFIKWCKSNYDFEYNI
jgi:hypothetical protein